MLTAGRISCVILKAIKAARKKGMSWELGKAQALDADLFKRKDDVARARDYMTKAMDIMRECGADGWVAWYEEELARL